MNNTNLLDIWNLNSLWQIIASIKIGDKISIRGNYISVDRNTPLLPLKRKFYGDSRDDIYQFVDYLFEITKYHLEQQNHIKQNVNSFLNNILNGIRALLNLRETYSDDIRFLAMFNSSLQKISLLNQFFKERAEVFAIFIDIESKICISLSPNLISTPSININNNNVNNEIFKTPNDSDFINTND